MKLIKDNKITAITASAGAFGTDYGIANVQSNAPQHFYIADAATCTITVLCAGAEGFFMSGLLADTCLVSIKDASAAVLKTVTVDCTQSSMGESGKNQNVLIAPVWVDCPANTNSIELMLTSPVEHRGSIANFLATGSGDTGRFVNADSSAVFYPDTPDLRVGGIVNTTLQIKRLDGSGSETEAARLSSAPSSIPITSIKNPLRVGVIRAGSILELSNPQQGITEKITDFSRVQNAGRIQHQIPGEISRAWDAQLNVPKAEAQNFMDFYTAKRSRLCATEIFSNFSDPDNKPAFVRVFNVSETPLSSTKDWSELRFTLEERV